MLDKPITDVDRDDILQLVADSVSERQRIDYKVQLELNNPQQKDEFRRDVSSFANASGGDLIIGMRENDGIAVEIVGMDLPGGQDRFKLRLSEILQSHIRPRIPGVVVHPIEVENGRWVVVVRVPRSFNAPHQVQVSSNDFQFWARNSAGKFHLDVDQLRSAFVASDSLAERIRSFRADRIGRLVSGITPVTLEEGPRLIVHVVPVASFADGRLDLSELERISRQEPAIIQPLQATAGSQGSNMSCRFNLDGFMSFDVTNGQSRSYLQVFRSGALEAVQVFPANRSPGDASALYMNSYEKIVMEGVPRLQTLQERLHAVGPAVGLLSLVGVKGRTIYAPDIHDIGFMGGLPIDEDIVLAPDVTLEGDLGRALRPAFDTVWNAAGISRSPNYDAAGNWAPTSG